MLDADYITAAEQRARRFSGAYTGTSGTLAADVLHLIKERRQMTAAFDQLEADNAALREAVAARLQGTTGPESSTAIDDADVSPIPVDWILQGERELHSEQEAKPLGLGVVNAQPDNLRRPPAYADGDAPKDAVGVTAKFGTGAIRSDTFEEFRYDLVSPIGLREVARACGEGAAKYGDWNWEKGMPVHDLLNHAIAHIYGFLSGDRSEPHLGHAAWNLLAAIHSHELWPNLNKDSLRGPKCLPPGEQL